MQVFLSWSGAESRAMAEALHDWLPNVMQRAKPFMSSEDIAKGARWLDDINARLNDYALGIICVTPVSVKRDWVLFEAGALAKAIHKSHVCTLLHRMEPGDVSGPLSQFQATKSSDKNDVFKLVKTLNDSDQGEQLSESRLETSFEAFWPKLDAAFKAIPIESGTHPKKRSADDMLEETLTLVRELARAQTANREILQARGRGVFVRRQRNAAIDDLDQIAEYLNEKGVGVRIVEPRTLADFAGFTSVPVTGTPVTEAHVTGSPVGLEVPAKEPRAPDQGHGIRIALPKKKDSK